MAALPVAFLHGEQALVGIALAGLIALIGVPALLYVWLWHTKVSALQLSIAYLVLMAVLCGVSLSSPNNPLSIPPLTAWALGFILTLPWSAVAAWVLSQTLKLDLNDQQFAMMMMVAAGVNAVLLYLVARKMRRLIQ